MTVGRCLGDEISFGDLPFVVRAHQEVFASFALVGTDHPQVRDITEEGIIHKTEHRCTDLEHHGAIFHIDFRMHVRRGRLWREPQGTGIHQLLSDPY